MMAESRDVALDPNSEEAQAQGKRDTEGRPVIRAIEEKKKEEKENKEKPVDPE
jgi:hypothetical protein